MRVGCLSFILLVIISGCASVKTTELKELKNTTNYMDLWMKHNQSLISSYKEKTLIKTKSTIEKIPAKAINKRVPTKVNEAEAYVVTGYNNDYVSTGKRKGDKGYGVTASGAVTVEGVTISADWRILPKGTVVYIESIGKRVVQDKGGAIKGHKIDLYFESEKAALNFGRQKLKVTVISKPEKK